jgi:hypothetical protein
LEYPLFLRYRPAVAGYAPRHASPHSIRLVSALGHCPHMPHRLKQALLGRRELLGSSLLLLLPTAARLACCCCCLLLLPA